MFSRPCWTSTVSLCGPLTCVVCRTIKLWDLEKFTIIGSLEGDTSPVRWVSTERGRLDSVLLESHLWPLTCGFRCVLFSPDGSCLYSGATDSLRVFGWEPNRCFDVVPVGWGKVSDLAVCNQQLVRRSSITDLCTNSHLFFSTITSFCGDAEVETETSKHKSAVYLFKTAAV